MLLTRYQTRVRWGGEESERRKVDWSPPAASEETTRMTTKEEARVELKKLAEAVKNVPGYRYLRWETLDRELEKRDFPYTLEQTNRDDLGRISMKNLYYWRSRSWERGALYINETEAGRKLVTGVRNAVEALRKVLEAVA